MTAIQVAAIGAAVAAGRSSQRRKVADLQAELGVARTGQEELKSQLQAALSELAAWQDGAEAADGGRNLDAEGPKGLKTAAIPAEQPVLEQDRTIKNLKNRLANLEGELESAPADFWLEQGENGFLERDVEREWVDENERVSVATDKVMHLEVEITDLEEELDRARKIDQEQKAAIGRLSGRLEDARTKAKDLAGAEERAKRAVADGEYLLAELEQTQQRAQKADKLEDELAQTSTLIETANRAKDQLALEMKSQKTQHAEEKQELREQRDRAREEARKAKEERDVPAAMQAEMKEKDDEISQFKDAIAASDKKIEDKDQEIKQLNKRLRGAERRADSEEQAAKDARKELEVEQGENRNLRKRVHDLTMQTRQLVGGVAAAPVTAVEPITGGGIREAVLGAVQLLGGVAIPESAMQHIEALDRESREGWREKVLGGLQALNEYATDRGDFPGNYYQWVQQGMGKDSAIGAKNVAMKDSETTAAAKSTSKARLFEIDPIVTGDSWMQMEAHLKFGTGTPNAPRIYFHDDTRGSTGKVHVGFIGPHSKVPTSGGF